MADYEDVLEVGAHTRRSQPKAMTLAQACNQLPVCSAIYPLKQVDY